MSANVDLNDRPKPDQVLVDIANYVCDHEINSVEAYDTARNCLMDTLGCGILALNFPECTKLLGPIVEGTTVPNGARVPGTKHKLDPVKAAWDIGCIIRSLDLNDTWNAINETMKIIKEQEDRIRDLQILIISRTGVGI